MSQLINVEDTTAPTASNPASISVQCFIDIPSPEVSVVTDESDNCLGALTVAFVSDDVTSAACDGAAVTVTRRYSVTDCAGNSTEVSQTIIVEDTTAPVITGTPEDVTVECEADIPRDDSNVMAIDNCGGEASLEFVQINNDIGLDTQRIVNRWTATDCAGNIRVYSQIVTFIVKQPAIELIKSSVLTPVIPFAGDTVFYDFELTNTGNTTLFDIDLIDPAIDFVSCEIDSVVPGATQFCQGWTILTQDDVDNGIVCNSAVVQAMTVDGIMTIDTSDSGNIADQLGTQSDKTYTVVNQAPSVELIKTINSTVDLNGNGVLDIDDEIIYQFEIINTGNVTLTDFEIDDPIVDVQGILAELQPGQRDSVSFSASYQITEIDANNGFVLNSATVNASTPASLNGLVASDISDSGDPTSENNDGISEDDGDSTNDPVVICVLSPFIIPDNLEVSACLSQEEIAEAFENWRDQFSGGGCEHFGVFTDLPELTDFCGASVQVEYQVIDELGNVVPDMSAARVFEIIANTEGPVSDGPLQVLLIDADLDGSCVLEGSQTIAQLESQANVDISDGCSEDDQLNLTFSDAVVPADCDGGSGFMAEREVIRTYTISDECGNESPFTQGLTITFSGCNQLEDFGEIGFEGNTTLLIPAGCTPPAIEETSPVSGSCGYVEHMWLMSTQEHSPGIPFIPNPLNLGTVWFVVDGATDDSYQPDEIAQNTYYVRCSRDISCCDFGESNIIRALIDSGANCPIEEPSANEDCDNPVVLESPTDDRSDGEIIEYRSDKTAEADIYIHNNSGIIIDAKQGTTLKMNFEVALGSTLGIQVAGCDN